MKLSSLYIGAAVWFSGWIVNAGSDSWTSAGDGLWRSGSNWSSGQSPSTSFDPTTIANAGTKTVTIDGATPAANLSIKGLSVSAPSGSSNTLLLSGLASTFSTGRPVVIGTGGALRVTNSTMSVLDTFDVSGGNLTIDSGLIDTTPNLVDIRIGRTSGATGTATLNGGILKCFGFRVGELSGSRGACTIQGGLLFCTSVLSLGEQLNSPGTISLTSGLLVATNDITKVGNLAAGTFNQTGGSSQFAFLSIGDNSPGTMTVSGGSLIVTPNTDLDVTRVGNFGDSQLEVSGGAVWLRGDFHIADNLGVNGTVLLSGATLAATNGLVAIGRYGIGLMTVTNATAYLTNSSVGRHDGATGTLEIQKDGSVFCLDDLSIGRFSNAVGQVTVSGGLLSLVHDNIWVGRGGAGDLTVSGGNVLARSMFVGMSEFGTNSPKGLLTLKGGLTSVSSNLVIGTDLISTGQVSVAGGTLTITNEANAGLLNISAGELAINAGTLVADNLVLTNRAGSFNFSAGTVQLTSLTASNGTPFVIGDGLNPATLILQGGAFVFADGLIISSNARVVGCGTIIGPIITNGLAKFTCAESTPPALSFLNKSQNIASLSFLSAVGKSYRLEFKDALSDQNWVQTPEVITGDGNNIVIQDSTVTNAVRFYRIRVQ